MPYADREVRLRKRREKRWAERPLEARTRHKGKQKKRTVELRKEALEALGGKCVRCGFSDSDALQIDHIYGTENGTRELRKTRSKYLAILRGAVDRTELQVLCANCHMIKTRRNRDDLNGQKLGPRRLLERIGRRAKPRRSKRCDVWIVCLQCVLPFLRPASGHEARKFCSHGCSTRYSVATIERWGTGAKKMPPQGSLFR